jgi:hypothetical protein
MPDDTEYMNQFFAYDHLSNPVIRSTSALFANLAQTLVHDLPKNPERTVALRKLLEAQEAACRAHLVK